VLIRVGDKPVRDSSSLLNLIAALPPGKTARLSLLRDGVETHAAVTVEKRPAMRRAARE
jgi:serine protease DegQ